MRVKLHVILLFVVLFVASPGAVSGKVYLDIDSPTFHKFPIAVPEFQSLQPLGQTDALKLWFAEEISRCLDITGYFQILDRKSFLEDPAKAGIKAVDIRFDDWTAIGAEYLLKGGVQVNGREMTAEFRLYDTVRGELLLGKRYMGSPDDKKRMVIRYVNEIILALTGETGNFDTRIAFVKHSGKSKDIYTIGFDGEDLTRVTSFNSLTLSPRWSFDGRFLAFTSYKDGNPDLYVKNMETGITKKLTSYKGINIPGSWSKDGERLLASLSRGGNSDIYDITVKNSLLQRLTRDYSIDVSPAASPDGKQVAFVSNRNGSPQIYTMEADGTNVALLTHQGNYNTSPAWSPRGGKIAYESSVNGRFQIFVVDAAGGEPQQLTFDPWDHESPSWSPDGRYLAYSVSGYGRSRIEIMNADGKNVRVLYQGKEGCQGAAWSPYKK